MLIIVYEIGILLATLEGFPLQVPPSESATRTTLLVTLFFVWSNWNQQSTSYVQVENRTGKRIGFLFGRSKNKIRTFSLEEVFRGNFRHYPQKKSFHSDLRRNYQGPLHQPLFSTCTRRNVYQSLQRCLTRRQSSFSKQVGIQSKGDAVRHGVTPIDSIQPLKLASLRFRHWVTPASTRAKCPSAFFYHSLFSARNTSKIQPWRCQTISAECYMSALLLFFHGNET